MGQLLICFKFIMGMEVDFIESSVNRDYSTFSIIGKCKIKSLQEKINHIYENVIKIQLA